jgi:hypothetical protein
VYDDIDHVHDKKEQQDLRRGMCLEEEENANGNGDANSSNRTGNAAERLSSDDVNSSGDSQTPKKTCFPPTTLGVLREIMETKGAPGLYAGMTAKLAQTLLNAAVLFVFYEKLLKTVSEFMKKRRQTLGAMKPS